MRRAPCPGGARVPPAWSSGHGWWAARWRVGILESSIVNERNSGYGGITTKDQGTSGLSGPGLHDQRADVRRLLSRHFCAALSAERVGREEEPLAVLQAAQWSSCYSVSWGAMRRPRTRSHPGCSRSGPGHRRKRRFANRWLQMHANKALSHPWGKGVIIGEMR